MNLKLEPASSLASTPNPASLASSLHHAFKPIFGSTPSGNYKNGRILILISLTIIFIKNIRRIEMHFKYHQTHLVIAIRKFVQDHLSKTAIHMLKVALLGFIIFQITQRHNNICNHHLLSPTTNWIIIIWSRITTFQIISLRV